MGQHAPGPWSFDQDDLGIWINSAASPMPIAKMCNCTLFDTEANARLIAAAPDMYKALKKIVAEAESDDGLTAWDGADIARAALARVTNEQTES